MEEITNKKIEELNKLFDSIEKDFKHLERTRFFGELHQRRKNMIDFIQSMGRITTVISAPI